MTPFVPHTPCHTAADVLALARAVTARRIERDRAALRPAPATKPQAQAPAGAPKGARIYLVPIGPVRPKPIRCIDVQRAVAIHFGLTVDDLTGHSRKAPFVLPRQIAMRIAHELCRVSLPEIGRRFGGRDHTTVLYATRKLADMADDPVVIEARRSVFAMLGRDA